ncbi:MAG TPA: RNA polymerase sigma factor [Candidatus Polarisedimenticolaceae bacterium]|nr:RNA polymerase sigma factor [Candidatus Polarisedimenticolaceae bacterium]
MEVLAIRAPGNHGAIDPLVARAKAGDFGAFEGLYNAHLHGVYAICMRMTANRSRAEELTQETFVRAWQRLAQFRGEGGFAGWLRRMAVNVVLGDSRATARRRRRETVPERTPAFPGAAAAHEPARAIDLEHAIERLPTRARHVFVLHDIEGYRHEEIARRLGVAVGTSKAQLHRARKLLREALRE